jgi:hypothetical protein
VLLGSSSGGNIMITIFAIFCEFTAGKLGKRAEKSFAKY